MRQPIASVRGGAIHHEGEVTVVPCCHVERAHACARPDPNARAQRVAIYARPVQHAAGVVRVIQGKYDISTHADWCAFLSALPRARGAVVFCPRLGRDLPLSTLSDMAVHQPFMPWLVVTEGASDNLRLLVHIRATEALCWGTDDQRIAVAIWEMLQLRHFDCLADKFRHMYELPSPLRSAIGFVLSQASRAATDDAQLPVRSIRELAARMQQSEDTLSAAARRHGVDLRSIIRWAVTLWAIQLHAQGGTWEAVAWRLDYSSMSGLSDLFVRTVGMRPTAMPDRDIVEWFDAFEQTYASHGHAHVNGEALSESAKGEFVR